MTLPTHPETCRIRCDLWAAGIIGRYFSKDDVVRNLTINGASYGSMISNLLLHKMSLELVKSFVQTYKPVALVVLEAIIQRVIVRKSEPSQYNF